MSGDGGATGADYVVVSELACDGDPDALERAFQGRLGAVDGWPGFRRLEVWRDPREPSGFVMVSWWASREDFVAYMRSDDHRRSHARIPTEEARPRPVRVRRYEVVAR